MTAQFETKLSRCFSAILHASLLYDHQRPVRAFGGTAAALVRVAHAPYTPWSSDLSSMTPESLEHSERLRCCGAVRSILVGEKLHTRRLSLDGCQACDGDRTTSAKSMSSVPGSNGGVSLCPRVLSRSGQESVRNREPELRLLLLLLELSSRARLRPN